MPNPPHPGRGDGRRSQPDPRFGNGDGRSARPRPGPGPGPDYRPEPGYDPRNDPWYDPRYEPGGSGWVEAGYDDGSSPSYDLGYELGGSQRADSGYNGGGSPSYDLGYEPGGPQRADSGYNGGGSPSYNPRPSPAPRADPRRAGRQPHPHPGDGPQQPRIPHQPGAYPASPSGNPGPGVRPTGAPPPPAGPGRPPRRDAPVSHRTVKARNPRSHWLLMAVMMLTLASMLMLGGILNHQVGAEGAGGPHQPLGQGGVPSSISQGGPVIDTRAGAQRSLSVQPGKVALTFDDGPDPTWTPQVLAVLAKHHVPGTFFVIGAHVAEDPDIVRDEVRQGDEVGLHTFTHDDLGTAPEWRRSLEFSQTQSAIAGATGISTPLLRPPYSSEPDAVDRLDWAAIQDAGKHGYLVVLTDRDSEDWRREGVQKILDASIPTAAAAPAGASGGTKKATTPPPGFVLMMHDGGGDRSETVAALDRLIPELQARGYTFDTVTGAIGAPSPLAPASSFARWKGEGLILAVEVSNFVVRWLGWAVLASGIIGAFRVVLLLVVARRHRKRRAVPWGPPVTRPVSVIVPAYNEEAGIRATVDSLSASSYPIEIIVVDDGSTDGTSAVVEELIRRRRPGLPPLRLIRQENGGKPAALNTGTAAARGDLLVMMDGDTVFERNTIGYLVQPFADPSVGAVSGNAKVGNRKGILGRWQHIEYVVGFNLERRMYDLAGCMPTVPGAVGAFRREALARVGGVSDDTLAEDTDLTMAVIRDGWRAVYEERAVAWTEAPSSLRQFWRQRYRWCYGTLQAMWKHRRSVLRRGSEGKLGRRGLTYMLLFQVLMPLLAPVVDVFAIYGLVFNDAARVGAVWLGFLAVQLLMALYAFKLDGERPTALWTLPLQQVVYRQLMYLVVIHSLVTAIVGSRLRWQRMQRYGSLGGSPGAPAGAPAAGQRGV